MKKFILVSISILPLIYFVLIYSDLNSEVAIHYKSNMVADVFINKNNYLFIICPVIIASSFNYKKFYKLSLVIISFLSIINIFLLSNSVSTINLTRYIFLSTAILFLYIGILIKDVQYNKYFGVRTKYSLKNEVVFKKTNERGGNILIIYSFLIFILSLFSNNSIVITFVVVSSLILISLYLSWYAKKIYFELK